jgi:hypothetical protein
MHPEPVAQWVRKMGIMIGKYYHKFSGWKYVVSQIRPLKQKTRQGAHP